MKQRAALVLLLVCFFIAASMIVVGNASASGDAANLDRVDIYATPSQQAVGGEIEIKAVFTVYGGCCYHLYTYDVVPIWEFPEQFEIVSGPTPKEYKEIDGLPGGEAVLTSFKWTVKCWETGDYTLKVTIDSDNCGSVENDVLVSITEGPVITAPVIFPAIPETGKDTSISFRCYSALENFEVTDVKFFYKIMNDCDMNLSAEGPILTINEGGLIRNLDVDELPLTSPVDDPTTFDGKIPAQDGEVCIYYWVYAKDTANLEVTTPLVHVEVTDFDQANNIVRYVFFSFLLISVIGIVLIMVIHNLASKRHVRDKTRLFLLGSQGNTEFMEEKDRPKEAKPVLLYIVIALVLLIAIALIIMMIYTGSYEEIVKHLREGK